MLNFVRRIVLCITAAACMFQVGLAANETDSDRTNIIFILADDLGYNQLGCYGDTPINTPNIDRLAGNGIRFTQAYAGNTVCSPSRVSLFTGRDGRLMQNNSNTVQLKEIDVTFAHVLKHAGYNTALFGKYSIGSQMGVTDPLAMGFDTWYGMYSILEGHRQYPQILWRDGEKIRVEENEGGRRGAYAQELFATEAIAYINQKHDNPFFVILAFLRGFRCAPASHDQKVARVARVARKVRKVEIERDTIPRERLQYRARATTKRRREWVRSEDSTTSVEVRA